MADGLLYLPSYFAIILNCSAFVSHYCLMNVDSDKINLVLLCTVQSGLDPSLTCSHVPMPQEFIAKARHVIFGKAGRT